MPASKLRRAGVKRPRVYMALRRKGHSKTRAAKIANSRKRQKGARKKNRRRR